MSDDLVIYSKGGVLTLNKEGMILPMTLLSRSQQNKASEQGTSIEIKWGDIKNWTASMSTIAIGSKFGQSSCAYDWYVIKLKKRSEILGSDTLAFSRKDLIGDEKRILDYARPLVSFKLDPMRVTLWNSWPWLILIGGFLIFAVYVFTVRK